MTVVAPEHDGAARPCVVCGSRYHRPLGDRRLTHLRRCIACGLVSVRELPGRDAIERLYDASYFQSPDSAVVGYDDYAADRITIERTAHRRLRLIERFAGGRGVLLDAGCALGFFLAAARRRGWTVRGVDISAHATASARDVLGLDARTGTIEDAGFGPASFDAVTMWDVVEHLPDPVATLHEVRRVMRPGGILALSTPDAGSWPARITGARWMGYKLADEHLYYFDRRTMRLALEAAGFEVLHATTAGKYISLDFFARRLELYLPPVARAAQLAFRVTGLGTHTVYVDPRDIMLIVARPLTGG